VDGDAGRGRGNGGGRGPSDNDLVIAGGAVNLQDAVNESGGGEKPPRFGLRFIDAAPVKMLRAGILVSGLTRVQINSALRDLGGGEASRWRRG
jgi:hypothetical protein